MKYRIDEIAISNLEKFINSNGYKSFDFYPISRIRALSHIKNPRAKAEDVALFLAYDKSRFIGYLGGVPDVIFFNEGAIKTYWISCLWVLPEYRRSGLALQLMNHAYDTYKGSVLITNYIPRSRAVFDKTGHYTLYNEMTGLRGFVRFDFRNILPRKNKKATPFKPLLAVMDTTLNFFINSRLRRLVKINTINTKFIEVFNIDQELIEFFTDYADRSTFRRGKEEFEWILNYPWVVNNGIPVREFKKYYFSQQVEDFKQWFVKIKDENNITGFLVLNRFKGELKTPYLYFDNYQLKEVVSYLVQIIVENNIKTFVCHNQLVNKELFARKIFFHKRPSKKGFLISKDFKKQLVGLEPVLQEGDGDGVFT